MKDWKDNVSFILVEPKEQGNIGASARALKNMGFTALELVRPRTALADEAERMACHAKDVLKKVLVHDNLRGALSDKSLVVGTTRRLGKTRGLVLPLPEGVKRIMTAARENKVAVLFGREEKGLTNREVEACGFLMTIPTDPRFPSLNLAQSVMLVAYELGTKTYKRTGQKLVTQDDLEDLYAHIHAALKLLEYIPRGSRDLELKIMRNLRHLFGRAGLTDWEMCMLHGICSQIEKKAINADKSISDK